MRIAAAEFSPTLAGMIGFHPSGSDSQVGDKRRKEDKKVSEFTLQIKQKLKIHLNSHFMCILFGSFKNYPYLCIRKINKNYNNNFSPSASRLSDEI